MQAASEGGDARPMLAVEDGLPDTPLTGARSKGLGRAPAPKLRLQ